MGNIYGNLFRVATFGESHGKAVGCVIDGCPPMLEISEEDIQVELDRRRPGQSDISTPRSESDTCQILSGVFEGKTLGTPICVVVFNKDQRSGDYSEMANKYRPSHADYTYDCKYGTRDYRGGGRSSARETIARVIAGAIAKKALKNISIKAWVESIHSITMPYAESIPSVEDIEASSVRCPDAKTSANMIEFIKKARSSGDSVGGTIRCVIENVPAGLGEPVFDRLHAQLAKAMLSIPACKAFEIGSGFASSRLFGSTNNDEFYMQDGNVRTKTNNAGGVLGGISSGENIDFKIAFKPTATIAKEQNTVDKEGNDTTLIGRGRHDPCVLPRAVPIVEAMAAMTILDFKLIQNARQSTLEEF
ncbi:MAG: chorismate synthase [Opitutales bacterium]